MTKHDDGGPAMPSGEWGMEDGNVVLKESSSGMSLLDYFAGECYMAELGDEYDGGEDFAGAARDAYDRAEAMIAEKRKREADE